jgi:hypothetical protein
MEPANERERTAAVGVLRAMRKRVRLSRPELARRASCSLSMLGLLEGGYTPQQQSPVMDRCLAAIAEEIHTPFSDGNGTETNGAVAKGEDDVPSTTRCES